MPLRSKTRHIPPPPPSPHPRHPPPSPYVSLPLLATESRREPLMATDSLPHQVRMDLLYAKSFMREHLPAAYERLLLECLVGDHSHFVSPQVIASDGPLIASDALPMRPPSGPTDRPSHPLAISGVTSGAISGAISAQELEAQWQVFDSLLHELRERRVRPETYALGSRRPVRGSSACKCSTRRPPLSPQVRLRLARPLRGGCPRAPSRHVQIWRRAHALCDAGRTGGRGGARPAWRGRK